MRFRSTVVVAVMVTTVLTVLPRPAWAPCLMNPLVDVVERSDVIVVGTVSDYEIRQSRIFIRLDVEQTLKGSLGEGSLVVYQHCGPFLSPEFGEELVGTRSLFFLTEGPRSLSMYGDVITPQVSDGERIEMTEELLGIGPQPTNGTPGPPTKNEPLWMPVGLALLLIALVAAGGYALVRRRRSTV